MAFKTSNIMEGDDMKKAAILILLFIMMFVATGCISTASASDKDTYPAVVAWNNFVYGLSLETISPDAAVMVIGEVSTFVDEMPAQNGESNSAQAGSTLFKIKDTSFMDAIAVDIDGTYYKAYNNWKLQ